MAIAAKQLIERLTPGGTSPTGSGLTVELAHAANPDIGSPWNGYWDGEPGENDMVVAVASLADASAACRKFIDEHGLGSGNWTGGTVRKNGQVVARISYNGRAWTPEPYPAAKEIPLGTEL